jgi:hypothetical protein
LESTRGSTQHCVQRPFPQGRQGLIH